MRKKRKKYSQMNISIVRMQIFSHTLLNELIISYVSHRGGREKEEKENSQIEARVMYRVTLMDMRLK